MFNGIPKNKQDDFLFQLQEEMEDFIHFYEYVDNKINSDKYEMEKDIIEEFDIDGNSMGFSGPTVELDKIYSAPAILYSSIFNALYSFFELKLTGLINDNLNKKTLKISLADLKADNEINKVEKFINKVLCIDLSDMEADFKLLHEYRRIRNAFVHHGGLISKEKEGKELFNKIQQDPAVSFYASIGQVDSGRIWIKNSAFLIEFAKFIPIVLGKIFNKLNPIV